jgi:multidrug efflux pump subunit AcrA (membrane-fusion protein)
MRVRIAPVVLLCAALASLAALGANAADSASSPTPSSPSKGIQAITKPSNERVLGFERPGKVMLVNVDVGSEVKAGDILAQLDDSEYKIQLRMDKHKAELTDLIAAEAEEKVLIKDQKKLDAMTINPGAASQSEIWEQEATVEVDKARIKMAKDQIEQDQLKVEATQAANDKQTLKVPDDCKGTYVVAQPAYPNQTLMQAGEIVDSNQTKIIRIVKIDPMWVDVPVPTATARKLNVGDSARVTFTDGKVLSGSVLKRLALADAGSGTLVVRVQVPNPDKLEPGEKVFVTFSAAPDVAAQP